MFDSWKTEVQASVRGSVYIYASRNIGVDRSVSLIWSEVELTFEQVFKRGKFFFHWGELTCGFYLGILIVHIKQVAKLDCDDVLLSSFKKVITGCREVVCEAISLIEK